MPKAAKATEPEVLPRDPNCTRCPLSQEGEPRTICMDGDGPRDARVMIIGEGPGYQEDQHGRPFIGKAGQYLDRGLERVDIARDEVFVTNVVRCRPPDNRAPTRTEINACRPYLEHELREVQPEIVVLAGNSALQGLLKTSGILSKRGAAIEKDGRTYFPILHPAFILRDPSKTPEYDADMAALKRLLDGTNKPPETTVHIVRDPEMLARFLGLLRAVEAPIAFDVETDRLEWWHPESRLDTVAFAWQPGEAWVIPLEHPERAWVTLGPVYGGLTTALTGKRLMGHNVKFDLLWLASRGIRGHAHADTMVMAHLLDENRSVGLKPLSRTHLGADLYEQGVEFGGDLTKLAEYNGRDADYTLRLYHLFRDELREEPRLARLYHFISMPALRLLVEVEQRGFPVDMSRLKDRHRDIQTILRRLERELLAYVPFELHAQANFRPSGFLTHWLFNVLKLPISAVSAKTNKPSVDKSVMRSLAQQHPVIPKLLEYRRYLKWESTYTRSWMTQIKTSRRTRLYPSYNMAGTVTGRLSSNFQQVPRDAYIRGIIGARPGRRLIEADFSQIELRIAAVVSQDPTMIQAYRDGADLHMLTAMTVTGKPAEAVTKEERTIGKSLNFGLLYGMGWRHFREFAQDSYGVTITEEQAQFYRHAFFNRYGRLAVWHDRQKRLVREWGYVNSPLGRIRRLTNIRSSDESVAAEAERQAINSPVQGLASDLTMLAMIECDKALDRSKVQILGNLHDAIIFEVVESSADEVAAQVKSIMESLPLRHLFGWQPSVPIVADVRVVQHWGEQ